MTPRPFRVSTVQESLPGIGDSPDTARARAQGAVARESGAAFENELKATHGWYARQGIAHVEKHHVETDGWGETLHVVGKGPFDWSGVARGWPVAFETKVIDDATYVHERRKLHQVRDLLSFRRCGGLSFILLHDRELDLCWLLTNLAVLLTPDGGVPVRSKHRDGTITHHLPVLRRRVGYPVWDWAGAVAPHPR